MAKGWMVVFRPDQEAEADGLEDEVFDVIYTKLVRAKKECSKYLESVWADDPQVKDYDIDWGEDTTSTPKRLVYFGRPKALVDGNFYLYEMKVEL